MADRVSLSMFWVYVIAIPFYLFFNVGVTGNHIPDMQAIAYDLTPEINNWFTRIDPFSNGMPSLHIGLPFAIWLTMHRWDDDGRWTSYRGFLMGFIVLTAFAIIYLGIHWMVDIIGGMAVGILAVQLTAKTNQPVWDFVDERLFSRRLARAIADPSKSIRGTLDSIISVFAPLREPSRKQTSAIIASAIIAALMVSTGLVLLWDATHQDFPVEGVEWPTSAAGSDGWLVSVEEDPDTSSVSISVWNVSERLERQRRERECDLGRALGLLTCRSDIRVLAGPPRLKQTGLLRAWVRQHGVHAEIQPAGERGAAGCGHRRVGRGGSSARDGVRGPSRGHG